MVYTWSHTSCNLDTWSRSVQEEAAGYDQKHPAGDAQGRWQRLHLVRWEFLRSRAIDECSEWQNPSCQFCQRLSASLNPYSFPETCWSHGAVCDGIGWLEMLFSFHQGALQSRHTVLLENAGRTCDAPGHWVNPKTLRIHLGQCSILQIKSKTTVVQNAPERVLG